MATILVCDACLASCHTDEEPANNWRSEEFPIHLQGVEDGKTPDMGAYVDADMNSVSGRRFSLDFCPRCYNAVMTAALEAVFKERNRVPR